MRALWGVSLPKIYESSLGEQAGDSQMGSFRPAAGCGAAKILPRDRLAAAAGFVSAIAGESHHTRNERDPRSVAELTFSEASSGDAEFCVPASLKTSFTGQSLDRLANSAARKKSVEQIVSKQLHSMFNPRARTDTMTSAAALNQMP